eukprot:COSAG01_NODE_4591_length_4892_cov_69.289589_8_plen_216_part_00
MHSEVAAAAAAAESQINRARSSVAHGQQQGAASAVVASDGTLLTPSLTSDGASMSESWLTRLEVSCRGLPSRCALGSSVRVWGAIEKACCARAGRQQHLGPAAAAAAAGGSSSLDLAAAAVREDGAGPAVRGLSCIIGSPCLGLCTHCDPIMSPRRLTVSAGAPLCVWPLGRGTRQHTTVTIRPSGVPVVRMTSTTAHSYVAFVWACLGLRPTVG